MVFIFIAMISYLAMLVLGAINPNYSKFSDFEIRRRLNISNKNIDYNDIEILRAECFVDIYYWIKLIYGIVSASFVSSVLFYLHSYIGAAITMLGVISCVMISNWQFFNNFCQRIYNSYELKVLHFACRNGYKLRFLYGGSKKLSPKFKNSPKIVSRDEIAHVIAKSSGVLTANEKKLLLNGLKFAHKKVEDIMTLRSDLKTVNHDDVIGPLLLDNLHKTGNVCFPVIKDNLDNVVGIIYLSDVISIDTDKTKIALKVMRTPVYYIKNTQNLEQAIAAFLKVHNYMFVVVDSKKRTVGILTIGDVIRAVVGYSIINDFDGYDDLNKISKP